MDNISAQGGESGPDQRTELNYWIDFHDSQNKWKYYLTCSLLFHYYTPILHAQSLYRVNVKFQLRSFKSKAIKRGRHWNISTVAGKRIKQCQLVRKQANVSCNSWKMLMHQSRHMLKLEMPCTQQWFTDLTNSIFQKSARPHTTSCHTDTIYGHFPSS